MGLRTRALALSLIDAGCWVAAVIVAVALRYDLIMPAPLHRSAFLLGLAAAALFILTGALVGLYAGRHRLGSYQELRQLAGASLLPTAVLTAWLAISDPRPLALSIPLIAMPLALMTMLTARGVMRAYRDRRRPMDPEQGKALVFGAGDAAEQLVRSLNRSSTSRYRAVAILDDDPRKANRVIDGIRVVGTRKDLERAVNDLEIECLIVAVPSADSSLFKDLDEAARSLRLRTFILPPVAELLHGEASAGQLREISERDILGRHVIETDLSTIADTLNGKVVLVTGAGGSIGAELCRQIAHFSPARLVMLDRDESALHAVQLSMTGRAMLDGDLVLADIRDAEWVDAVFAEIRPDVVFHAAALKHLSLLERYPEEAWKTNVVGTANVLQAARRNGVGTFINISTDKAADPICVLGYSKRITERLTASVGQQSLGTYASVRFGNVLGSRGSMLGTFQSQIQSGGPVTITHPDVRRYFMTIPEAVELVLQATAIASDGEVLILDMGDEVRIDDVARRLIQRSGKHVDIVYTGLRPGEKLSEVLLGAGEVDNRPNHPLITQANVPPLATVDVEAPELASRDVMRDVASA